MIVLPGNPPVFTVSSQSGNTSCPNPSSARLCQDFHSKNSQKGQPPREGQKGRNCHCPRNCHTLPKARLHFLEWCPLHLHYRGTEEHAEQGKAEASHRHLIASEGFWGQTLPVGTQVGLSPLAAQARHIRSGADWLTLLRHYQHWVTTLGEQWGCYVWPQNKRSIRIYMIKKVPKNLM